MNKIKNLGIATVIALSFIAASCSSDNENEQKAEKTSYAEIEKIAIEHANKFNENISSKEQQGLLLEVQAHEANLRSEKLDKEADHYIKYFTEQLKKVNPEFAKSINL